MKLIVATVIVSVGITTLGASVALGQPMGPSAPMSAASGPRECPTKHDHGAERGLPAGTAMNCAMRPDNAASAPAKKKVQPHDHAKFHKNQG